MLESFSSSGARVDADAATKLINSATTTEARLELVSALTKSSLTLEPQAREAMAAAMLHAPALPGASVVGQVSTSATNEWFGAAAPNAVTKLLGRFGFAGDGATRKLQTALESLDPALQAAFVTRLSAVPREVAIDALQGLRADAAQDQGVVAAPGRFIERVMNDLADQVIDPAARAAASLPVRAVPGLSAAIDSAAQRLSRRDGERGQTAAMSEAVMRVLEALEPDLRGSLQVSVLQDPWFASRVVAHVKTLGLSESQAPSTAQLDSLSEVWRSMLGRAPAVRHFESAANFEPTGSFYRNVDADDPALVSAALELLLTDDEVQADLPGHFAQAVQVLASTGSKHPDVNVVLEEVAARPGRAAVTAAVALAKRGVTQPAFEALERASTQPRMTNALLIALRDAVVDEKLEVLPESVRKTIREGLERQPGFDTIPAQWVSNLQPGALEVFRALGLSSPALTEAAARTAAERSAYLAAREAVVGSARAAVDAVRSDSAAPARATLSLAAHAPAVQAALGHQVNESLQSHYRTRVSSRLVEGVLTIEVDGDERR